MMEAAEVSSEKRIRWQAELGTLRRTSAYDSGLLWSCVG
jgi:hypothetical protein